MFLFLVRKCGGKYRGASLSHTFSLTSPYPEANPHIHSPEWAGNNSLLPIFTFSPLIRFKHHVLNAGYSSAAHLMTLSRDLHARRQVKTYCRCTHLYMHVMPSYGHRSSHNGIRLKLLKERMSNVDCTHAHTHETILCRNLCGRSRITAFCPWGRKLRLSRRGHSEHCSPQTFEYICRYSTVRSIFKPACEICHINMFN